MKQGSILLYAALAACLAACAAGTLSRKQPMGDSLPTDLPADIQSKFEVKDAPPVPEPTASPSPVASPAPTAKAAKRPPKSSKAHLIKQPAVFVWPNRRPSVDPNRVGERHVFEITYFGMVAATVRLDILPHKMMNDRKVYHIRGLARTTSLFSLFYSINDTIETYIDYDGIFPHRFHMKLDETKQTRDSLELYDSEKGQTYYWNRWNHKTRGYSESKDFFPMIPFSQDSLSSLLYIRTLDLSPGKQHIFPVINEGKNWNAAVAVVKRETISTPNGPKRAVVLSLDAKYDGIAKKTGDSFLWISDDDDRQLLRLEAKVKIGTVAAALKSVGMLPPGANPDED